MRADTPAATATPEMKELVLQAARFLPREGGVTVEEDTHGLTSMA